MIDGERDPTGVVPPAPLVGAYLVAWLPAYRVLMVWLYDRTDSLLLAYPMHVPISATTFILVSAAAPATAAVIKVLVGEVFWLMIGAVAWANGGHVTRYENAGLVRALPERRRADAT